MSPARRKRDRRERSASSGAQAAQAEQQRQPQAAPVVTVTPLPQWRWRTFPVLFALSAGLFIGTWVGSLTGIVAGERDNTTPMNLALIVAAVLFGATLSRFATRWMMSRQWIKPRPAKPKKR